MNQLHVRAASLQFANAALGQFRGIVGRIIQHLDLQKLLGVIKFADGSQ